MATSRHKMSVINDSYSFVSNAYVNELRKAVIAQVLIHKDQFVVRHDNYTLTLDSLDFQILLLHARGYKATFIAWLVNTAHVTVCSRIRKFNDHFNGETNKKVVDAQSVSIYYFIKTFGTAPIEALGYIPLSI